MHTEVEFAVEPKTGAGKGAARKIRAQGKVPGVVYGPGMQPTMIAFPEKDLIKALSTPAARNVFLRVRASGHDLDGSRLLIKDLQVHPVRRAFVHVDFYKPDPTKQIHAHVPVRVEGTAVGVKLGGILQVTLREVMVSCLPDQLPESISIDVTDLRPGHSIHVGDLTAPEGVKILTDSKLSVCAVIGASGEEGAEAGGATPAA